MSIQNKFEHKTVMRGSAITGFSYEWNNRTLIYIWRTILFTLLFFSSNGSTLFYLFLHRAGGSDSDTFNPGNLPA